MSGEAALRAPGPYSRHRPIESSGDEPIHRPRRAPVAIFSRNALPERCGIAAHSAKLAAALTAAECHSSVLAQRGSATHATILPGGLTIKGIDALNEHLERAGTRHLLLQYTPLTFQKSAWSVNSDFLKAWRRLCERWSTSLIVHETYFREWSSPRSLLSGTLQKRQLMETAASATYVFSASDVLIDEMSDWRLSSRATYLPIGSNIERVESDTTALRHMLGIDEEQTVLTLFGGGNSLKWMASHVNAVEELLNARRIPHTWLLLGGVPDDWFALSAPIIRPGWLDDEVLSAYLQLTDLFLVPHVGGVSGKRGTIVTALQHGLPIIGTDGPITDSFWRGVSGVTLTPTAKPYQFAAAVHGLSGDNATRRLHSKTNARLFESAFTWQRIAGRYMERVGPL